MLGDRTCYKQRMLERSPSKKGCPKTAFIEVVAKTISIILTDMFPMHCNHHQGTERGEEIILGECTRVVNRDHGGRRRKRVMCDVEIKSKIRDNRRIRNKRAKING